MRPQGRGELESLYFTYPRFAAPRRDVAVSHEATDAVVIVGAGPVGLVAALTLAHYGVRALVLERKDTFNDGSRAICIARASYQLLDQLGALAPFLAKSLGWTTGRTFYRGKQILEFDMPHTTDERFLPMYNLQQQYIEQYLFEAASRSPLIEIRWKSEVTGIDLHADSVAIRVDDPMGTYALRAPWLLAADGARSAVRTLRGKRLQGENYEGRYVIADVRMRHDYPTIRRALFDPACRPGGTVLIHKQPDDIWRIDYQLGDGETPEAATREDVVRRAVAGVLAEIGHTGPWELEWWSVYSANTLALDDYRDGRIFYIGDSAHIVPIFGVRGLNNGIADAHNIGWKLAYVMGGQAGDALLDSYSPERRGATLDVFANASRSARFMTPQTPGWKTVRDAALSLALSHPFAGAFANPRQMTPYTYAASPLTLETEDRVSGVAPGQFAANARLRDGGHLLDRIGRGFTLFLFGDVDVSSRAAIEAAGRMRDPHFKAVAIDEPVAAYGAGAVLIRPDYYIAARWHSVDAATVGATLARLLAKTGSAT